MDAKNLALTVLGKTLQSRGYRFVAMTPANHCRVLDRPSPAATLESIFGWNRAFDRDALDPEIFDLMEHDEALEGESGRYESKVALPPSTISSSRIGLSYRLTGRRAVRTRCLPICPAAAGPPRAGL